MMIVLLLLLSASISIASAYSRDGATAYLNKVQPTTYGKLLFSKLMIPLVVGAVGTITTTAVFASHSGLGAGNNVLFGLTAYFFYVAHLFWSAEMDLMNPQYAQYATFAGQSHNVNENKSIILCFALAILASGAELLLAMESVGVAWIKMVCIAFALCAMKVWSYFIKIKVFYKEK